MAIGACAMPDWINPVIDEKSVANVLPLAKLLAILP